MQQNLIVYLLVPLLLCMCIYIYVHVHMQVVDVVHIVSSEGGYKIISIPTIA